MSITLTETTTRTDVTPDDTDNDNFSGWFCIYCSVENVCVCGEFKSNYLTAMHLILVWPSMDDVNMLQVAAEMQRHDLGPKIKEYEEDFGKCVSYYEMMSNPAIVPHKRRM